MKTLRALILGALLALPVAIPLSLVAEPVHAELVLREDTASQAVVIGPFVDSTDGDTAETALTIDAADVRISINGGNIVGKNSGGCTHDELGYYTCTFDATDTATVGRMQVMVKESGALPVYHEFQVVEEEVYDACCATSAAPATPANIWAYSGGRTTTGGVVTTNNDKTGYGLAADAVSSTTVAASAGTELAAAVTAAQGILTGTCDSGSTTTCVDNALTQADASQLEDRLICFDDSWCALITTFTPGSDTATTTKTAPSTRASKAYTIFPATLE